jgi:hypothetical protein
LLSEEEAKNMCEKLAKHRTHVRQSLKDSLRKKSRTRQFRCDQSTAIVKILDAVKMLDEKFAECIDVELYETGGLTTDSKNALLFALDLILDTGGND